MSDNKAKPRDLQIEELEYLYHQMTPQERRKFYRMTYRTVLKNRIICKLAAWRTWITQSQHPAD